ncbi:MAG TPA: hypothetical protein VJB59_13145 [Bdellovibrionota bacterium]|nr:hypothetical protein [Bdellovibrionota bacterium]
MTASLFSACLVYVPLAADSHFSQLQTRLPERSHLKKRLEDHPHLLGLFFINDQHTLVCGIAVISHRDGPAIP